MRNPLLAAFLLASLPGCARPRTAGPPAVFPITTAWTTRFDAAIEPPLATDGARVFVATRDGVVTGLEPKTGEVLWRVGNRPGFLGAGGGLLALRQADGIVWAMEPGSGSALWKVASGVPGKLPPVVHGGMILVAGEGLAALDAATGRNLWSVPGEGAAVAATPVASGPSVLVGEADGTLRCRDAATGASLWTHRTRSTLLAPPIVDDRRRVLLGTTDGAFLALRLDKKGKRRWRWKLGADVRSAAALLDDKVIFATYEDVLYALKRGNGHMVWRAPLPSRPLSGPLLAGSAVLVACYESDVVGFDGRTGKRLGGLKTPAEIATPPLFLGGRLLLGLRDRSVAALELAGTAAAPATPPPGPSAGSAGGLP